jgi:aminoglycoside 6'-N-acetyltransferase
MDVPSNRVDASGLRFSPMRKEDLPLLKAWLSEPHVAAWWQAPESETEFEEHYISRIEGKERMDVFMIELGGQQIGMIQAGHLPATSAGPASCGIDLLLGRKDLVGRGLGPASMDAFVTNYVFGKTPAEVCTGDPDAGNGRCILACEKAGFHIVSVFMDQGRPHLLLARNRSDIVLPHETRSFEDLL